MKKYINPKDKIAILEDKYNSMEDGNYKAVLAIIMKNGAQACKALTYANG